MWSAVLPARGFPIKAGESMARPRKEGLDYFPHDTDAVNDEKIEALRALYGNDGYAFYFILLERIYRTENVELDIKTEQMKRILAKKIQISKQKFEKMLLTAFEFELFDRKEFEERGVLTSRGIKRRAGVVFAERERKRKRVISPGETTGEMDGEIPGENPGEMGGYAAESKVKKTKENYIYDDDDNNKATEQEKIRKRILAELEKIGILTPSPFQVDVLAYWITQGMEEDAVIYAVHKAGGANVRRVDYIDAILRNWHNAGVRTLKQAEAEAARFESRKAKNKRGEQNGKPNAYQPTSELPEWERKFYGEE